MLHNEVNTDIILYYVLYIKVLNTGTLILFKMLLLKPMNKAYFEMCL